MPRHGPTLGASDTAGEEEACQANAIFSEPVTVHVKPAARDEFMSALTVRLKPDNPTHPRSLLLELTDESDLLFYHSLMLGEGDFHALKSEQRLLVDFQSFPAQLVELLRRCMEVGSAGATSPGGTEGLRLLTRLDVSASGDSIFSIVESNQFRELTHIALRLRQGTDEVVKRHLAGKLRTSRTEIAGLTARLRGSEEALSQARRQVDELTARTRVVAEERAHMERTLESTHHRELSELRQEHARALGEAQSAAAAEKARVEAELQQALTQAEARANKSEQENQELKRQQEALSSSGKSFQGRFEAAESQLQDVQKEIQQLRDQNRQLDLLKFQQEKEICELKVQVTAFRDQLSAREQLVATQSAQIDQASAQRKNVEDMLASCRQQVHALEEKFALSAQEIAKGNQIIQSLHTSTKQAKAKLRIKANELTEKERAMMELEKAEDIKRHVLEEKENEISRAKDKEAQLREEIKEFKVKLSEAQEVLKSNQEVIEYLNRQLTEKELKAIPPVPGGGGLSGGIAAALTEVRGASVNDILTRLDSGSKGQRSMGCGTGYLGLGLGGLGSPVSTSEGAGFSGFSTSPSTAGSGAKGLSPMKTAERVGGGLWGTSSGFKVDDYWAMTPSKANSDLLSGPVAYRNPDRPIVA